jgi:hypothetical protein
MLDIQCSEVTRGQITLKWKPDSYSITDFIKSQIGDHDLSLLVRIESETDIWHESIDILQGEYTVFLRAPGEQIIKVFPVISIPNHKENLLETITPSTFNQFQSNDGNTYYDNLKRGFKYHASLL